ncbi:uncharacterized protein HD556DRAFT_1312729 [Suillus plorans]|uniref:Uncharacterized protein n=1 Tax=Suillus plorans TaxID=116603 RepID=A0A9P7ADY2_9AGAM|nr:uncharacterized protein HD556DRAFT_1312729 [Suillus plorans]KAG1787402.1 hypothetical protein HD556DRAFT_1312729 [Suillus plorans]
MAPNRNADLGRKYLTSTSTNNQVDCQYCNRSFLAHGIKSHEQSCLRRWDKKNANKNFAALAVHAVEKELQRKAAHREKQWNHRKQTMASAAAVLVPSGSALDDTESLPAQDQQPDDFTVHPWSEDGSDLIDTMSISGDAHQRSASDTSMGTTPIPNMLSSLPTVPSARSNLDTFKTEYHPHSGRTTSVEIFSTFGRKEHPQLPIIDEQPWQPFTCHVDFEFAELAHGAALNKNQTDEHCSSSGGLRMAKRNSLSIHAMSALYMNLGLQIGGGMYNHLCPKMIKHISLLLAWLRHTRSSLDVETCLLVSEIPMGSMVPDDSKEDGKLMYVNLKRVVWHKSFLKLLENIIIYAEMGDHAAGEKALKEQGLQPVKNVFWSVPNSDPHDTISQDHLHIYHMGQWKHLFGELKRCIAALGRSAEKQMDDQFDAFPL